ncbi:hypothetical protein JCM8097_009349 [Rhodosporidiobolus ruineniae]
MAPTASSSRNRRRSSTPSSGDDDHDEPNGASHAYAQELDDLELKHPAKTCRHLFLQTLMNRRSMSVKMAKQVYHECCRVCKVEQPDMYETFVANLEPGLSMCGLDIKMTRDQETGEALMVLANTIQDEPAKLATEYKPEEIAFFRAILEKIMTAPHLSYSITQADAARCVKPPITRTQGLQLLKSFLAKGWLTLHSSNRLILSPRSLVELSPYLRDTFNDDEEDADDPRHRAVVDCNYCLNIVTSGYACPNEDCGIRLHTFCVAQQVKDGRCPDHLDPAKERPCDQTWTRDPSTRQYTGIPVGVSALEGAGSDDDDDVQNFATSEADLAQASGRKKGRKSVGGAGKKGKERAAESEEEEDELMNEDEEDEEASHAATSPTATRKSSRARSKKRVTVDSEEEEDDD